MRLMWLFSLTQSVLSVAVIVVSVRLCRKGGTGASPGGGAVTACLRSCLGWAGAVGAAVNVPVDVLLNMRSPQCLYVCITLVCCPLLVRQFTVGLQLLLTVDAHLQWRLGHRYTRLVRRQQALCLVLLVWVASVVTAFSQFIVSNSPDTWAEEDSVGLGLEGGSNHTSPRPPPRVPHPQDRSVIGKYLPYAGFLSKFVVKDLQNFTYEELHGNHWAVCAPDAVLDAAFFVGVYAVAVFLVPLLVLLAAYLDLACTRQKTPPGRSRSLALSLLLLVLLCLPLHTTHVLRLLVPASRRPVWATLTATLLFQAYGLVPPLLFTPETTISSKLKPVGSPAEFCPPRQTPKAQTPDDV
ncbi:uncharacterized protein LOC113589552 [Electrophorus electricus]|uniref:uncharacterized protein LOC113589552 n=1 Tax=Electrophorus electricus TaxID=8005 RepID=UPI0015D06C8A|nr:uncharacterized protein LOC113589552 [Electrophorus electricus]